MSDREVTAEEWKEISDIYGYMGYIKGSDTICLDGDFSVDDLKRIVVWLDKQIKAKS